VHVWLEAAKNEFPKQTQVKFVASVYPMELSHSVHIELDEHVRHPFSGVLHKTQLKAIEL
jgi:hypothetical protein